jgi:hypothetical protein
MGVARHVRLEIDAGEPPLHGRLHAPPDRVRSFSGWLGMIAALQAAIGVEDRSEPARRSWSDHDDSVVEGP